MPYTYTPTSSGTIQVSQGGKIVSTTTADNAAMNYGYTPPPPATKPVSAISTQQGVDVLTKTQQQAGKLSGTPPVDTTATGNNATDTKTPPAGSTGAGTTEPNKVTLINSSSGQTVTFNDASINKDNIKNYLGSGFELAEASGNLPDWLAPTTTGATGNKELDDSKAALTTAKADLSSAVSKLTSFDVTNDPQLKTLLGGITSQWDQRIADYTKAEDSRIAALTTTGVRLGSQWTGGAGGMTGSLISAEEKAEVDKIAGYQSQKQQALAAAQSAFETGKWKQYNDLVQIAQKAYDNQLSSVSALQKAQASQDTKIQDAQKKALQGASIAKLITSGTTDPAKILDALRKDGDNQTTLDDISKTIKDLTPSTSKDPNALKFSVAQLGKFYSAGLSKEQVQALSDYYNGADTASPDALSSLSQQQQTIVHEAMNGLTTKPAAGTKTKPLSSGSLTYTSDTLGKVQNKIASSKGEDGYVDPNIYKQGFDAWIASGGLAKDFLRNFPPKTYVNPTNDWLPKYLQSKTSTKTSTDLSSQISSLFPGSASGSTPQK